MSLFPSKVVIAGGSGFIGAALAAELVRRGRSVTVLTRSPKPRKDGVREVAWDGRTPGTWGGELEGAEALVNLTGKSVNCPHTEENVREIVASRVDSVRALATAVARCAVRPKVWVQASATGFYGDTGDRMCDESGGNGADVLAKTCREWEGTMQSGLLDLPEVRSVVLRIGFVLGSGGGALSVLAQMTRWGLGGAAGSGRQYISWIHLRDVVRIFAAAVEEGRMAGVYNTVGPQPVTNGAFMRELRRVLGRPWSPPAPSFAVRLGARMMGSEGSLALVSQRCEPKRLLAAGFVFEFPELAGALQDLCGRG